MRFKFPRRPYDSLLTVEVAGLEFTCLLVLTDVLEDYSLSSVSATLRILYLVITILSLFCAFVQ